MGSSPPGSPQFLRLEKRTGQTNPSQPNQLLLGHPAQDPGWGSSWGAAAQAAEKKPVSYSSLPQTHALQRFMTVCPAPRKHNKQCRRRAPYHTGSNAEYSRLFDAKVKLQGIRGNQHQIRIVHHHKTKLRGSIFNMVNNPQNGA